MDSNQDDKGILSHHSSSGFTFIIAHFVVFFNLYYHRCRTITQKQFS